MSRPSELRNAQDPLKHIWLIDPKGLPVKQRYAKNISTGVLRIEGTRIGLTFWAEDQGWKIMEKECSPKEWAFWTAYDKACESGRRLNKPPADKLPKCIGTLAAPEKREDFVFVDESPEIPDDVADDIAELEAKPAKKAKA